VLESELEQLEQRVQRLVAAYRQARLETKRAIQERDRMFALNNELKRRIEGIVESRAQARERAVGASMNPRPTVNEESVSVTVRIMGREYTVVCPPEEHEALVASADFLNERMTAIRKRGKALGAERIAVMAALNLARELLESRGSDKVVPVDNAAIERVKQLRLDIDSTLSLE
jgi:cell division protein ZapA